MHHGRNGTGDVAVFTGFGTPNVDDGVTDLAGVAACGSRAKRVAEKIPSSDTRRKGFVTGEARNRAVECLHI